MKTINWKLEGMRCGACAHMIQARLVREPGVKHAEVSYPAGTVRILLDAHAAGLDQVRELIERAGYRVDTGEAAA